MPALDGLRAIAVLGVIAFHADLLRGGFLGVDLFFVLSGFLITSLLLAETTHHGHINLTRFWARRARRLLPPLLIMLAALAVYARTLAAPTELSRLRADGVAALFYYANWHALWAQQGYWDLFSVPSPLAHCWSLAIEEQFYLLWPLLVALSVRRRGAAGPRGLLALCGVGTIASWLLMAALHPAGADTSRVYFGTDTRASALLMGAGLASWRARHPTAAPPPATSPPRWTHAATALSLLVLASGWWALSGRSQWLYWGGFAACQIAVAWLLWLSSSPSGSAAACCCLTRALSWRPLRYLGRISYGLYLWHWPVFVIVSEPRSGLVGFPLLAVQVLSSMALAVLSHHAVEQPLRRRASPGRSLLAAGASMVATAALWWWATQPRPQRPPRPRQWLPPQAAQRSPLSLLIAGDSVAERIANRLLPLQQQLALTIRAGAVAGCGLIEATAPLRLPNGKVVYPSAHCPPLDKRWQTHPQSDAAVYLSGAPSLGDYRLAGRWQHACQPAFDSYIENRAAQAISALVAAADRVYLTTMPYVTSQAYGREQDLRTDCINAAITRAAASHPRASIIDLAAYVCPQGRCRSHIRGVLLRHDGQHFEGEGAEFIGWWLSQQLDGQP